jgi:hypothetical protein
MRDAVRALVERYQELAPESLRLVVWYDGDDHDLVHVRDDVRGAYSPEELEEKVKQLVIEGISDPPSQEQFRLFGEMSVVIRRFDLAVVLHFPLDEFSGVAVTFDRETVPSLDTLADAGIESLGGEASQ